MSPLATRPAKEGVRVPRASGDEPLIVRSAMALILCSPRERG